MISFVAYISSSTYVDSSLSLKFYFWLSLLYRITPIYLQPKKKSESSTPFNFRVLKLSSLTCYNNSLTAMAIFRKLAKNHKVISFYMSEYEITRILLSLPGWQSTSYLVVGRQCVQTRKQKKIHLVLVYITCIMQSM